jgi:membrane protein
MATASKGPPSDNRSPTTAIGTVALGYALTKLVRRPGGPPRSGNPGGGSDQKSRSEPGTVAGREEAAEPAGGAASPTQTLKQRWWHILKNVYHEIDDDRILAVAAGVTFYVLLALFPATGAFVAVYGLVAEPATIVDTIAAMGTVMPGGAVEIIGDQIKRITSHERGTLGFAFISGLAISLWSANAGIKAMFDALNVAYEEKEKRGFIMLNLWSLAFTLGAIIFILIAMGTVVVVPIALNLVGLGAATEWLIAIGRWPVLLGIILVALAALYRWGPSRVRASWVWVSPGSALAAIGWVAFSMLFSWYVSSFGNYNETYGSLGAAIGFMTWIWLSSTIILIGAELNSELEHQAEALASGKPPLQPGEKSEKAQAKT